MALLAENSSTTSSISSRSPRESDPSLCRLAEPHLYSHILLKMHELEQRSGKPANLTELLSKRPYIAHYIRSLEIPDAET